MQPIYTREPRWHPEIDVYDVEFEPILPGGETGNVVLDKEEIPGLLILGTSDRGEVISLEVVGAKQLIGSSYLRQRTRRSTSNGVNLLEPLLAEWEPTGGALYLRIRAQTRQEAAIAYSLESPNSTIEVEFDSQKHILGLRFMDPRRDLRSMLLIAGQG